MKKKLRSGWRQANNSIGVITLIDLLVEYRDLIQLGIINTLAITTASFVLGFVISLTLTLIRFFAPRPFKIIAEAYIDFFRGTPLLVQILLIYFGLPSIGIKLNALTSATLAIGLNSGAYQAEIIRTAIKGIPEEQILIAESFGLTTPSILRYVVFPQALRNALPGLTNEAVTLLKESSLASIIGVLELTRTSEYMTAATFRALEAYLLVALIYLTIAYAISKSIRFMERFIAIPGFRRWA